MSAFSRRPGAQVKRRVLNFIYLKPLNILEVREISVLAGRRFFEEFKFLLQRTVTVVTTDGKEYVGSMAGYNPDTMSVCLKDVRDKQGNVLDRIFINGSIVAQIYAVEKPFDLRGLADRLEKVFPRMVNLYEDLGVIVVMDKIRVGEKGIIEGRGPAAERVKTVYDEFVREQPKS